MSVIKFSTLCAGGEAPFHCLGLIDIHQLAVIRDRLFAEGAVVSIKK